MTKTDCIILSPKPFSAEKTFDCGQCFRFVKKEKDGKTYFEGIASGKNISVEETENEIIIYGADEDFVKTYFALGVDYSSVKKDILSRSGKYAGFVEKTFGVGDGIRILRQDRWEALCTFILSQNNNIPRIKKLVEALSSSFGEEIKTENGIFYAFPTPLSLYNAGIEKIAETRCGFRAKYIFDAAEKVVKGEIDLESIDSLTTNEATEYLCRIKGVGVKVASCTLLFGFGKYDAFPIDVWMKKVIEKRFDSVMPELGEYKGIAQQFLFYYERYIGDGDGK